jgi:hypothetical protein
VTGIMIIRIYFLFFLITDSAVCHLLEH